MTRLRPGVDSLTEADGRASTGAEDLGLARFRMEGVKRLLLGVLGVSLFLVLWKVASGVLGVAIIFPPPEKVFVTLLDLLASGEVLRQAGVSVSRAAVGFGIAATVGVVVGLGAGRIAWLDAMTWPLAKILFPIPGAAWIPIGIMWFGITATAIIFVVFIGAVFSILVPVRDGAKAISSTVIDVARGFGARRTSMLIKVILPAVTPSIMTGLRLGIAHAWRMIVTAELVGAVAGIGYFMNEARYFFRADVVLASVVVIGLIGFGMERLLVGGIERLTVGKWYASSD